MIKNYYPELDALKGIAILFIILSHSFCEFPIDIRSNLPVLNHLVGSFALCLFFICSGFLFRDDMSWSVFFKKKGKRLLIPLLFFGYANVALRLIMAPFTRSQMGGAILFYPLTGQLYWFLYSLFLIMVLDKALSSLGRIKYIVAIALLLLHEFLLNDISLFTINRTSYFYVFFVLGRVMHQYYETIHSWAIRHKAVLLLVMLIYCAAFIAGHTIYEWNDMPVIVGKFIIPLSACASLWILFVYLELQKKPYLRLFHYFGKYSLQYYCNHMLILLGSFYFGKLMFSYTSSYILSLLGIFCLTLLISYIMLNIEQRLPERMKICFGL